MPDCLRTAAISQRQRPSFAWFQRRRTLSRWRARATASNACEWTKSDKPIPSAIGSPTSTCGIEPSCSAEGATRRFTHSQMLKGALSPLLTRGEAHDCLVAERLVRRVKPSKRTRSKSRRAASTADPQPSPHRGSETHKPENHWHIGGCCARTASGHAAAAPCSSAMNVRRFTRSPRRRAAGLFARMFVRFSLF
jgi:hypothetical protein